MREMKDSGIECIGAIPVSWKIIPIKFVASCNDDSLPEHTNPDTKISYVDISSVSLKDGISHIESYLFKNAPSRARRLAHENDVIVSTVRTYLKAIAYVDKKHADCVFSTGFAVIRPRNIFPRFLDWALISDSFVDDVIRKSNGVSYPSIKATNLINIFIPLPSINEQISISAYLDSKCSQIDEAIRRQESIIGKLKEYRQSVITEVVTKGLDPNANMKNSEVPWLDSIPSNWKIGPLKYLLINSDMRVGPFGSALKTSDYKEVGIPVYVQKTVLDNAPFDTFVSTEKAKELSSFTVTPGDYLITTRGTIGRVCRVSNDAPEGILHPCLIRFRLDEKKILPSFFLMVINDSLLLKRQFEYSSNGTTIDVIYSNTLKMVMIPLPPISQQKMIVEKISTITGNIDESIRRQESIIEKLKAYRQSLIYEVVTGKKEVV